MDLLLYSFAALCLGPVLVVLARRASWSTVAVDSFCVVALSGFALLHLLPECAARAGWPALVLAVVGFVAPLLAERALHRQDPRLRKLVLWLCLLGIAVHATLDGLAVYAGGCHHHGPGEHTHTHEQHTALMLAWGVILHRIPEGIGIWWIVPRTLGRSAAVWILAASALASAFGFFLGPQVLDPTSTRGMAMFQALLAGSLLHVVLHAHVPAPRDPARGGLHLASATGALLAAGVVWAVIADHGHFPEIAGHSGPGELFLTLALESAPALLVAYLLVGLSQSFLPARWLSGFTRGGTFRQALRGVAIGLPLPVCSCGVVPIYHQMVRRGAAVAAAIAFLVATPELEIAAVLLTWQLMGGELAIVRMLAAALLALAVGMLVGQFARRYASPPAADEPEPPPAPLPTRLKQAVRFGLGPAVDNTASWILVGLLLSALLMPYVDREWIASLPRGIDVPAAALLGLPIYVCATGSTPLAAMLLAQGVSPGAGIAFLLTGPATNVTTFGMVARLHGKGAALVFCLGMWSGAVALGWAVNAAVAPPAIPAFTEGGHQHGIHQWIALTLLAVIFAASVLRQGVRPFIERLFESPANYGPTGPPACCAAEPASAGAATGAHGGHGHDHDHGPAHHHHHHDHPAGHDHGCGHSHDHGDGGPPSGSRGSAGGPD